MSLVDVEDVPEPRSLCSTSNTLRPRPAASRAMPTPLIPPPITARSKSAMRSSKCGPNYWPCPYIPFTSLQNLTHLSEREARIARRGAAWHSFAQNADEVRLPMAVWEELGVDLGIAEARHRAGIEPE